MRQASLGSVEDRGMAHQTEGSEGQLGVGRETALSFSEHVTHELGPEDARECGTAGGGFQKREPEEGGPEGTWRSLKNRKEAMRLEPCAWREAQGLRLPKLTPQPLLCVPCTL